MSAHWSPVINLHAWCSVLAREFHFQSAQLVGTIPSTITSMTSLTYVVVVVQQFADPCLGLKQHLQQKILLLLLVWVLLLMASTMMLLSGLLSLQIAVLMRKLAARRLSIWPVCLDASTEVCLQHRMSGMPANHVSCSPDEGLCLVSCDVFCDE